MTNFTKEQFISDGAYLHYDHNGERLFVSRFKWNKRDKARFQKFLINNFTVEEYFAEREKGIPPMLIVESKGFESTNKRR